ncbi:E3 ubiquitin-protein ligase NRDP1-like protein [Leptotrombidium deliense]|uniref:E3 ubiquitin-protein ligase NRDP1-like protein n=1 Tax=Leptotrombidium deliense TaxID=299467 RepID=A0A443SKI7_9ACAR|nr:E3 ubiquitin-protein ligase NRDP1-like protein [Leptotrombidium deliense]
MGFDPELFVSEVDDELICPICHRVVEDAVQGNMCDHIFCGDCIRAWLSSNSCCPMDRSPLRLEHLRPVFKIVTNLLNRLQVKCPHESEGCLVTMPLFSLKSHLNFHNISNLKANDSQNSFKKVSELSLFREMLLSNEEFESIADTTRQIEEQFKTIKIEGEQLSNQIEDYERKFVECSTQVSELQNGLLRVIVGTDDAKNDFKENGKVEIYIQNLSEFTNEGLLFEYLRQNDIFVESVKHEKTVYTRSLNFNVTVTKLDMKSVLDSNLWPLGVTVYVKGDKSTSICGSRSKNEQVSVYIKAGITCYKHSQCFP